MLFLTYWELNEATPASQQLQAAQKLMSSGLFPPKNVTILRWDATPDNWGILLAEADSVADVNQAITMWRAACPGFFAVTRTAPAMPVQETIPATAELLKTLAGAS
jgi:hypothetical protein